MSSASSRNSSGDMGGNNSAAGWIESTSRQDLRLVMGSVLPSWAWVTALAASCSLLLIALPFSAMKTGRIFLRAFFPSTCSLFLCLYRPSPFSSDPEHLAKDALLHGQGLAHAVRSLAIAGASPFQTSPSQ